MKIVTILGTRPEIIRLSTILPKLDRHTDHVLVHTGQNYDASLSDVFFKDLDLRAPDVHLGVKGSDFSDQLGQILVRTAEVLRREKPDRVLILGDTNSALTAIVAARMRIPVYHMEAGNRCYDDRVPEEINRRIVDHTSDVLLPYTQRSMENLVREGIPRRRIFVTGNPIFEVLQKYAARIQGESALEEFGVEPGHYFLATLHRAENVDDPDRLKGFMDALSRVAEEHELPVLVSVHPRTQDRLRASGLSPASSRVRLLSPMGFLRFVKLEQHARCVLTDSGTVQEECAIFRIPNVTLRDVTERPETMEAGSNIIAGGDTNAIVSAVRVALAESPNWLPPPEYTAPRVSETVLRILMSHVQPTLSE